MGKEVVIGGRTLGNGKQPFIVAEAGINHNGSLDLAFQMIVAAKDAGVDAVKFQTFKAEEFIADEHQTYTYMSQGKTITESMFQMFKRCEFSRDEWFAIKQKCDEEGILFLSTPQNRSDLDLLLELGVPAIKVGSDDFTNLPLLKSYAKTKLPMIVSCGMSDLGEVYTALQSLGSLNGYPTILLLCTSQYPTPPEDVNLLKLRSLAGAFPDLCLGFSDHSQGYYASTVAVAFGACFFEKHFTLDRGLPGPDHWFSENPDSLREWALAIRTGYKMLGNSLVRPTEQEEEMRVLARRSIVAVKDIYEGEQLTSENVGLRRPGNGLPPHLFEEVLSKKTPRFIAKGTLLQWGDFLS
ncbi:N-acetylneuraminate synthase family protein [Cohnella silvisoli]|uniref:N-acetylneuraminate synthase family protein n=1 Tax=Cohnella silvisoli TaxID=2873699 RepID=A0ABV1KPM3_9BACL|nr:N-acetylneuraminate synthase family protein [Cohnella silvisoli]MCD9022316.1 N-acetylneuraminate synthase family protein [Cohnella silvisoli]